MKRQMVTAATVAVIALGLAVSVAWASGALSVNIPFSFVAKGKEMPAGKYEIRTEGDETKVSIRGGNGIVLIPVIERLADTGAKEPRIVFDKTDDGKVFLSEIHMPGRDGFLVGIAKGRETHVTLTGNE